jgi:hypothetical protein
VLGVGIFCAWPGGDDADLLWPGALPKDTCQARLMLSREGSRQGEAHGGPFTLIKVNQQILQALRRHGLSLPIDGRMTIDR